MLKFICLFAVICLVCCFYFLGVVHTFPSVILSAELSFLFLLIRLFAFRFSIFRFFLFLAFWLLSLFRVYRFRISIFASYFIILRFGYRFVLHCLFLLYIFFFTAVLAPSLSRFLCLLLFAVSLALTFFAFVRFFCVFSTFVFATCFVFCYFISTFVFHFCFLIFTFSYVFRFCFVFSSFAFSFVFFCFCCASFCVSRCLYPAFLSFFNHAFAAYFKYSDRQKIVGQI